MKYSKNNFQLIIIISFFIFLVNSSYIKIPYANKELPVSESDQNFHPFDVSLEFIEFEGKKRTKNNINILTEIIKQIPNIISQLLLSNEKLEINYDKKLINRLGIRLGYNQNYYFDKKKLKTDLLIIISFENNQKKGTIVSKFFGANGSYASFTYRQRIYMGLFKIDSNYVIEDDNSKNIFLMNLIKETFRAIGFRYKYLVKKCIKNKFSNVPLYLIENSKIYKIYKKLMNLNDIQINNNESSTDFYGDYWNYNSFKFHDIINQENDVDFVISELTMSVFNEMQHISLSKCDLFKFEQGITNNFHCLRVTQDCIDKKMEKDYFLEYGIDQEKEGKVKCYLNTKENIKKEQCGIKYGNLEYYNFNKYFTPSFKQIKENLLLAKRDIPEINIYKNQTIKLLKNPPSCKIGTPRTIFFQVPPDIFDREKNNTNIKPLINELKEINKDVEYEEITLGEKDKKYFVTYEAYEDNYKRESVTKVLNYSGIIRSFSDLYSHNFLIKNPQSKQLAEMGYIPSLQKIFSYNNFDVIAYKDKSYYYYDLMHKKFPYDYAYMPETYSYPKERAEILKKFKNYKLSKDDLWLVKPCKASLGKGIKIFHGLENTMNDCILTKYISNPHLINKLKYDFRVYVLISGLSPLKIYLYTDGLVRFTSEEYSLDLNKLDELYRHLTNVAINTKNKETYRKAVNADTEEGSKWSLQVYKSYCEHHGIDFKKIWDQMADIAIKSILAVRDLFLESIKQNGTKDKNHFKLFGYDFLVDESLKVFLIEVNSRPSLLMGDINDLKLKPQLIADTLNIVGITPYSHDYKDNFESYDFKGNDINEEDIDDNEDSVNRALCEFGRPKGRFELIFPLKNNVNYYKKFFKGDKTVDEMLWNKLK